MSKNFSIHGIIIQKGNRKPVAGVRIEAWDKDLIFDDFLGSASSDADGKFRIDFDSSKFAEIFFDRRPDVFFRLFLGDHLLVDTRDELVLTLDQPSRNITLEIPSLMGDTMNYSPALESESQIATEGSQLIVKGTNWPDCMVDFAVDKKELRLVRVITGFRQGHKIRPAGDGSFIVAFAVGRTGPGKLQLTATSAHTKKFSATLSLEVLSNPHIYPDADKKGFKLEKSFLRQEDFFKKRFGHLGFIPPDMRAIQLADVRRIRERKLQPENRKFTNFDQPSPPTASTCNWSPIGPACIPHGQVAGALTISGRVLCIAIDRVTPNVMFIGTAGGGIWKSESSGDTWSPCTDYRMSMAIGSIAISPGNHLRIYAGTGEYHHNSIGGLTYYGNGLLKSENGGDTWTEVSGAPFDRNEISRIAFDPTDTTNNRAFLSSATGVYQSPDGTAWTQLYAGSASDLAVFEDPMNAGDVVIIAAIYGSGLWKSTRSAGVWGSWTKIIDAAIPATPSGRIGLWQDPVNRVQITALFYTSQGLRIARTNNGGGLWTQVTIRFAATITNAETSSAAVPEHKHMLSIPMADLTGAPAAYTYTSSSAGTPAHTHAFSFTAQEIQNLASGGGIAKFSTADASGHQHVFGFSLAGQLDYNLVIAAHPTNANRYYTGNVWLWRTDDGLVFNPVSNGSGPTPTGVHADQHAFAFDPVNPEIVWAGNDGGLFRSNNGGNNWEARNRDLATLQYMHVSSHPQWENVLIGGSQDNGTHRYGGHPAWKFSMGGDGGFTAIDPVNPMRMYGSYIYSTFYRSDNAGAGWTYISGTIAASGDTTEFYPPFELDPSAPDSCYFGAIRLWRSPDNGDNWTAITTPLTANISALAIHPTNSNIIYAGCIDGKVYRMEKTGAAWDTTGVVRTEITGTGLPAGLYISDLAVEPGGTVWVTFSSVTWTESAGEFSNNHVFRLPPASSSWEGRNTGLAMANPVNSIVIDPGNTNRLFVGTDLGVFRTENSGGDWTIWDEGLPSVPIFHLNVFTPLRLLRAGSHGRGVWERPIDSGMCPTVDLYVRDNILDSGRRNPSPEYVQHPFDPSVSVYHWECADIKIDSPEGTVPSLQAPIAIDDYIFFEADLNHRSGKRSVLNRVYAQVHNRGVNKATNVKLRLFFADAHAGLPPLPSNFWTGAMPFSGTPGGTDWVAIGDAQNFTTLEAAEPGVKHWDYTIPAAANQHSCLLMVASCDENVLNGGGIFNVDQLVVQNKQVGLKNLHVENAPAGSPMPGPPMMGFRSENENSREAAVMIHWGNLPRGTRVFFSFSRIREKKPSINIKENLMKKLGLKAVDGAEKLFKEKRETRCGDPIIFDIANSFEAQSEPGQSLVLPGLHVFPKESVYLQFNLIVPETSAPGSAQFSIIQLQGKKPVGGCTYMIRIVGSGAV